MIEGGDHDMGVDYWDLIKPVFAEDRYSIGSWILGTDNASAAGSFLMTFMNRGEVGSDYRFSFYIAKPLDCPATGVVLARGGEPIPFDAGANYEAKSPAWSSMSRSFVVKTTSTLAASTTQAVETAVKPGEIQPTITEPMVVPTPKSSAVNLVYILGMLVLLF
jgi:hypothetical protein